jgi:hypothetical protein
MLSASKRCGEFLPSSEAQPRADHYGKAKDEPNIVLLAVTEGKEAEREGFRNFRANATTAATQKARELGWIVVGARLTP